MAWCLYAPHGRFLCDTLVDGMVFVFTQHKHQAKMLYNSSRFGSHRALPAIEGIASLGLIGYELQAVVARSGHTSLSCKTGLQLDTGFNPGA